MSPAAEGDAFGKPRLQVIPLKLVFQVVLPVHIELTVGLQRLGRVKLLIQCG